MENFDGLSSQPLEPYMLSIDKEEDLFVNLANTISNMTTDITNDKFSDSIYDTEFPEMVADRLNTRDILKQKIEDCCATADHVGADGKQN